MIKPVVANTMIRRERKKLIGIVFLVAVIAVAGFVLGYQFGQQRPAALSMTQPPAPPVTPVASQVVVPPRPAEEQTTTPQNLSFYDNLPKGNQAPLGSGINLPTAPEPAVAVPPRENAAPRLEEPGPAQPVAAGAFLVQIASFQAEPDAHKLVDRLQKIGVTAKVARVDLGAKGVWFRVVSGPYADRTTAEQVSALLKTRERLSALVRTR